MKKLYNFLALSLLFLQLSAQQHGRVYFGPGNTDFYPTFVDQVSTAYGLGGFTFHETPYLGLVDTAGLRWSLSSTKWFKFSGLASDRDSGFVATAYTDDTDSLYGTLISFDSDGTVDWAKKLLYPNYKVMPQHVAACSDTTFLVTGYVFNNVQQHGFVARINKDGQLLFSIVTIGTSSSRFVLSRECKDKSIMVIGNNYPAGSTGFLLSLQPGGQLQWSKIVSNGESYDVAIEDSSVTWFNSAGHFLELHRYSYAGQLKQLKRTPYEQGIPDPVYCRISVKPDGGFLCHIPNLYFAVDQQFNIQRAARVYGGGPKGSIGAFPIGNKRAFVFNEGPFYGVRGTGIFQPQVGTEVTDSTYQSCVGGEQDLSFSVSTATNNFAAITFTPGVTAAPLATSLHTVTLYSRTGCVDVTGAVGEQQTSTFHIYPVPADEVLTLESANAPAGEVVIKVLNLQGREIYSVVTEFVKSSVELNVRALPPGMYLISVNSGDENSVRKIFIAR